MGLGGSPEVRHRGPSVCVCFHRLSKELQQKDKIIESLQAQLNQHHHPHRSDTPCSSHALSDATDQLDRISYVSEDRGSTAEDLDLCSDLEAASQLHRKDAGETKTPTLLPRWRHPVAIATANARARLGPVLRSCDVSLSSSARFPPPVLDQLSRRLQLAASTLRRPEPIRYEQDGESRPPAVAPPPLTSPPLDPLLLSAPPSAFFTSFQDPPPPPPPFFSCVQRDTLPPQPRCRGNASAGFSLAEVHQELQMLQRQLGVRERASVCVCV